MNILPGTTGTTIAQQLTKNHNHTLINRTITRFPDNELYIQITDPIQNQPLLIIQTTYPDTNIIETLLLCHAAKNAQAAHITLAIPYYGYSRQDKQFKPGEPISAHTLAHHLEQHIDQLIILDPHKEHILNFFTKPAISESILPELICYLKKHNVDLLLAPDRGALKRTQQAAECIKCECDYLEKTRLNGTQVKIHPKTLDTKGKTVAIIDDIISTGGTMATAIQELKKQGAKKIYAACTHGLFINNAIQKLQQAGCNQIIASDSIPNPYAKISAAPSIQRALTKIQ